MFLRRCQGFADNCDLQLEERLHGADLQLQERCTMLRGAECFFWGPLEHGSVLQASRAACASYDLQQREESNLSCLLCQSLYSPRICTCLDVGGCCSTLRRGSMGMQLRVCSLCTASSCPGKVIQPVRSCSTYTVEGRSQCICSMPRAGVKSLRTPCN